MAEHPSTEDGAEAALAEAIANIEGVDTASVAGRLDAAVSAAPVNALEEDITNLSPASNSVAGNLDGGVGAVDWSSKTPTYALKEVTSHASTTHLNVSGSGYFLFARCNGGQTSTIQFDGGQIYQWSTGSEHNVIGPIRFDSSVKYASSASGADYASAVVVMD